MKTAVMKEYDSITSEKAVSILREGGIIIYPTETQYGIGADVANKKAVEKVFIAKRRPQDKKVIWAFSDIEMVKKFITLTKEQELLVRKLMPGPFTLVIRDQAFRIPDNETAREIIKKFSRPITTTSANVSGNETPAKIKDIISLFHGRVDLIIDAGDLGGNPSTVFRWEDRAILREGPVSKKEIIEAMK